MMTKSQMRLTAIIAVLTALRAAPGTTAEIDFNRDVRPILSDKCFACHGPDAAHREADLRLDVGQSALGSGTIAPGKAADSPLVQRITAADEAQRMPPPDSGKELSTAEIDTLTRWIAEGATYEQHWAYLKP